MRSNFTSPHVEKRTAVAAAASMAVISGSNRTGLSVVENADVLSLQRALLTATP